MTPSHDSDYQLIALDSAMIHDVDRVLNRLALEIRHRENYLPTPLPEKPPFTKWDLKLIPCDTEITVNAQTSPKCQSEPAITNPELTKSLVWDDRTTETKIYLMRRLYQAALNREIQLWNLFNDRVKEPPRDPSDIQMWVKTANIHTSDLLKFCERERIKIEFESLEKEQPRAISHPAEKTSQAGNSLHSAPLRAKRNRKDDLAVLIDQILSETSSLTSSEVMARLVLQIGARNSIILSLTGDGFQWDPIGDRGPVTCTKKNLEDRVKRWKDKSRSE